MKYGTTTSMRLPPELREQLEKTSRALHRGKNWVVREALQEYFVKHSQISLVEEAKRQSILVSQLESEKPWDNESDTSGWI
ncbi:hypothetical protein AYO45_06900 [Gammaproteobacteria bacterium SCGC AG-212-F23]|nr:hypothetical protein AYO45_06900 [Gammaproteobacteria bacterium SCGC AG-212-F23]